jgi:hypothetical protein
LEHLTPVILKKIQKSRAKNTATGIKKIRRKSEGLTAPRAPRGYLNKVIILKGKNRRFVLK